MQKGSWTQMQGQISLQICSLIRDFIQYSDFELC